MAGAAGHLGSDDPRTRTHEWIIQNLPSITVVQDGTPHAIHGLLGAVSGVGFEVLDRPDRRLLAVARPVTSRAFADSIPAGLMLPVVMSTANNRALLVPNNLSAQLETDSFQRGNH